MLAHIKIFQQFHVPQELKPILMENSGGLGHKPLTLNVDPPCVCVSPTIPIRDTVPSKLQSSIFCNFSFYFS